MKISHIRNHTITERTGKFLSNNYTCEIAGKCFEKLNTNRQAVVYVNGEAEEIGLCSSLATFVEVVFNYLKRGQSIADLVIPNGVYYNKDNESIDLVNGQPLLSISHVPKQKLSKFTEWLVETINNNLK